MLKQRALDFRVWDKTSKRFHADHPRSPSFAITLEGKLLYGDDKSGWFIQEFQDNYIIVQDTGFSDKSNSRIYEGDILFNPEGWMYGEMNLVVKWDKNGGRWMVCNKKANVNWDLSKEFAKETTIVGTVFENPEMIGVYKNRSSVFCG